MTTKGTNKSVEGHRKEMMNAFTITENFVNDRMTQSCTLVQGDLSAEDMPLLFKDTYYAMYHLFLHFEDQLIFPLQRSRYG